MPDDLADEYPELPGRNRELPDPEYVESELLRRLGDDAARLPPDWDREKAYIVCAAMLVADCDLTEDRAISNTVYALTLTLPKGVEEDEEQPFSLDEIVETLGPAGLDRDAQRTAHSQQGAAADSLKLAEKALVEKHGSVEPKLLEEMASWSEGWQERHYPWMRVYSRTRDRSAPRRRPGPISVPRVRSRSRPRAFRGASRRSSARSGDSGDASSGDLDSDAPGEAGRGCLHRDLEQGRRRPGVA